MKLLLTLVLMAAAPAVLADSAVIFEFPDCRSVALTSSGDISMAAETVSISPSGDMNASYDNWLKLPWMQVRCIFHLVNRTDSPVDITVGFPIDAKFGDAYTVFSDSMIVARNDSLHSDEDRSDWFDTGLQEGDDAFPDIPEELDFTASVDGEPMEVFYRTCAYSLEEEMVHEPVVAAWRMHFEPNQSVRLVNTYNTSWDYYGGGPFGNYTVRYVLTTGSTWKGPIGNAVIELEIPEVLQLPGLSDSIQACWTWSGSPVVSGRTVTWEYSQFEPDENIELTIQIVTNYPYEVLIEPSGVFRCLMEATPGEDILYSIGQMICDESTWGQLYNRELVLKLTEASAYLANNGQIPYKSIDPFFCYPSRVSDDGLDPQELQAFNDLKELRQSLMDDIDLAGSEGYLDFLPLFTVKYRWTEEDLDMFASMPEMEDTFLQLLLQLRTARTGGSISDPAMEALYRLTGWYHPGDSTWVIPDIDDALGHYIENRQLPVNLLFRQLP